MASVSSLDQDMRNLRMSRYTAQAAHEARSWIEDTLGQPLPPGDLLDALKDGVALCKLVNLVLPPPGLKFKSSGMPFIQMENISHFLRACEMPPLSMPAHDRFLTVDLYESKDPAQVLQCLSAFSRQAHAARPSVVRTTIGPKKSTGLTSPSSSAHAAANASGSWGQNTSSSARSPSPTKFSTGMPTSNRALTPSLTGGSTTSQPTDAASKQPSGPVSSWSKRADEGTTAPAWNIHQYGYMGGASQGNQGISFGARRQITSQPPPVPSLAEKERLRKEKAAEDERQRREAEEAEQIRQRELEAEEARTRVEEEARWEQETQRLRDEERRKIEEQRKRWQEDERKWQEQEEARRKEDAELQALQKKPLPPEKPRVPSSSILRGQTLSEYRQQTALERNDESAIETPEQLRVRELEKQLEAARERERQYQAEREERLRRGNSRFGPSNKNPNGRESQQSWAGDERGFLRQQWQNNQNGVPATVGAQRSVQQDSAASVASPSTIPPPQHVEESEPRDEVHATRPQQPQPFQPSDPPLPSIHSDPEPTSSPGTNDRPLPGAVVPSTNRTDRFLSSNPAPSAPRPRISTSQEAGDASLEQSRDRDTRLASQQKTKAAGWASKSLLEREMERERERQREWELNQSEIKDKPRDQAEGTGEGQTWDVNQYGFVGGDSMNRGSSAGSGINFGGRRQILGPREMASRSKGP